MYSLALLHRLHNDSRDNLWIKTARSCNTECRGLILKGIFNLKWCLKMQCSCCETLKNSETTKDIRLNLQIYILKWRCQCVICDHKRWYLVCECLLWSPNHTCRKSNNPHSFSHQLIKSVENLSMFAIARHNNRNNPRSFLSASAFVSHSATLPLNRITSHHFWRAVVLFFHALLNANPALKHWGGGYVGHFLLLAGKRNSTQERQQHTFLLYHTHTPSR